MQFYRTIISALTYISSFYAVFKIFVSAQIYFKQKKIINEVNVLYEEIGNITNHISQKLDCKNGYVTLISSGIATCMDKNNNRDSQQNNTNKQYFHNYYKASLLYMYMMFVNTQPDDNDVYQMDKKVDTQSVLESMFEFVKDGPETLKSFANKSPKLCSDNPQEFHLLISYSSTIAAHFFLKWQQQRFEELSDYKKYLEGISHTKNILLKLFEALQPCDEGNYPYIDMTLKYYNCQPYLDSVNHEDLISEIEDVLNNLEVDMRGALDYIVQHQVQDKILIF